MRNKDVISFRPEPEDAREFVERADMLGVPDSALARLSCKLGLDAATVRLARQQTEKAQSAWQTLQKSAFFAVSYAPAREPITA